MTEQEKGPPIITAQQVKNLEDALIGLGQRVEGLESWKKELSAVVEGLRAKFDEKAKPAPKPTILRGR